mmetsp:Transcript_24244/g.79830  ORF Transcript_24244/g.79830 Transcript_24244/m.79830 type:complete len:220 (-) Transcript_24244:234-893(-)
MSMPLSRSSAAIHALVRSMLSSPQSSKPTEVTVASCSCSLSVRNSGSISSTRSSSKARIPITCSSATDAFWHRRIGANLLISRSRFSSRCRSASSGTKSTLLSRRRSAKATCSTASFSAPSGFSSSRCCSTCFASTRVTIPSSLKEALTMSSTKKVWATGAGSAMPVVSMMTPSSLSVPALTRLASFSSTTIRSCRTVQQMQPFIISMISSSDCIFVFF